VYKYIYTLCSGNLNVERAY